MNTERIDIRVTPREKQIIMDEARKKKLSISAYIMSCVEDAYNKENEEELEVFPANWARYLRRQR